MARDGSRQLFSFWETTAVMVHKRGAKSLAFPIRCRCPRLAAWLCEHLIALNTFAGASSARKSIVAAINLFDQARLLSGLLRVMMGSTTQWPHYSCPLLSPERSLEGPTQLMGQPLIRRLRNQPAKSLRYIHALWKTHRIVSLRTKVSVWRLKLGHVCS